MTLVQFTAGAASACEPGGYWRSHPDALRCPGCGRGLVNPDGDRFTCSSCGEQARIQDGILVFGGQLPFPVSILQNFYDTVYHRRHSDRAFLERVAERYIDQLCLSPGSRYLDVSSGAGYALAMARRAGVALCEGVDFSCTGLVAARRIYGLEGLVLADSSSLPFADGRYDRISCLGSLEHYVDPSAALREMLRVSTADALFLFVVPNRRYLARRMTDGWDGQRIYTEFDHYGWLTFLRRHGFEPIRSDVDNHTLERPYTGHWMRYVARRCLLAVIRAIGPSACWQLMYVCRRRLCEGSA